MRVQHKWLAIGLSVATVCLWTTSAAHAQYKPAGGPYGSGAGEPYAKWPQYVGLGVYADAVNRPVLFLSGGGPYGNNNFPMPAGAENWPYGVTAGYGGYGYWFGYAPSFAYEYGSNRVIPVAGAYQAAYPASAMSTMPAPIQTTSAGVLPPRSKMATLDIFVADANAEVWVNGAKMPQMGQQRTFTTAELPADKKQSFDVRAKWTQNGKQYDITRTVTAMAGEQVGINFLASK